MVALIGLGIITAIAMGIWIFTETPAGKRWIKGL